LPDGYVQAVDPNDGEDNVSIGLDTIIISYNQPMKYDGGGGSVEIGVHYRLRNKDTNQGIPILDIGYNPANYELTLEFDNGDKDWEYDSTYELWIQASVKNECGNPMGGSVTTTFSTQSPEVVTTRQTSDLSSTLPSPLISPVELLQMWSCWLDPLCTAEP
jgi:hypothetical protein